MKSDVDRMLPREPVMLLDPGAGRPPARATRAGRGRVLRAYGGLVAARRLNDQASALVRQGRLAVYPSSHGQEACQVAAAQVLDDGDWLFPTYRDTAAVVARGVDPVEVLTLLQAATGTAATTPRAPGRAAGTPLATQLLHAVGVAHAARLRGRGDRGDGDVRRRRAPARATSTRR